MTILIVGGGASGMLAALRAAENPNAQVILLERQARVGRKLLATGNGRCNLTNRHAAPAHYHGEQPAFCENALARYDVAQTLSYLSAHGLLCVTEPSGKVYPHSDQAGSVVDVLRLALEKPNIQVVLGCEVTKVWKNKAGFLLKTTLGDHLGQRLIVAAGGPAGGKLGGTLSGISLLKSLGHTASALRPSLVQLTTDGSLTHSLKGVRADAGICLLRGQTLLAESAGEIQFTDFGLSGPTVFEVSRAAENGCEIVLDLLRAFSRGDLAQLLRRRQAAFAHLPAEQLLTGALHNRLGRICVQAAGLSPDTPLAALSDADLSRVTDRVKHCALRCTGTLDFDHAQVTAGGVRTIQFDPRSLESRLIPGVYACGEVLDIDGDCGGFNLQWAWSSGQLAGHSASQEEPT